MLTNVCPPLCHPERSRGTCGSADLSWKCFQQIKRRKSHFTKRKKLCRRKCNSNWKQQESFLF